MTKKDIEANGLLSLASGTKNIRLDDHSFKSGSVKWRGGTRLPKPDVGPDTSTAHEHSAQAGLGYCLSLLGEKSCLSAHGNDKERWR